MTERGDGRADANDRRDPVTVRVFHTGSAVIDRSVAFREETVHPAPYTGWLRSDAKTIAVPVSAYLIDHPEGPVLVDTGWHEEIRTSQRTHLGLLASTMIRGRLPPGDAIHEQVESVGVSAGDLEFVVITHLDSDHVSGLGHVPEATNIVVSEPEWDARDDVRYTASLWNGIDIEPVALQDIPHGPFERGLDLYGDGRIYLVATPGHSAGHLSVLVETTDGWILLASDAGYAPISWQEEILPGITVDDEEAKASQEWLREFARRDDCVAVLANHDRDVEPGLVAPHSR